MILFTKLALMRRPGLVRRDRNERARQISGCLCLSLAQRWTDRPTDDTDMALCILAPFLWQEIRGKCHIWHCQPLQSAIFCSLSALPPSLCLPVVLSLFAVKTVSLDHAFICLELVSLSSSLSLSDFFMKNSLLHKFINDGGEGWEGESEDRNFPPNP